MSLGGREFARRHAVFLAVFVLLALLYFSTIRPGHDWGGDFSVYLAEARNLARGMPYTHSTYVPPAESAPTPPAVSPPLTALVLAPVYAIRGLDYIALKAELIIFLCLSLAVYYLLAIRRGLPPLASAVVTAI